MVLTAYRSRTSPCASPSSRRAAGPSSASPPTWPPTATATAGRRRIPRPGRRGSPRRGPRANPPPELRGGPARRRVGSVEAPPAQLRGLRRVPDLRPGDSLTVIRHPRRRRRDRDLRGPLAGGRSGRADPRRGAELLLVINGSPYEREKDDTRLELVRRRAAQAGCAGLPQLGRRPGRAGLRRRLDGCRRRRCGARRGPQFVESLVVVDLELTPSTVDDTALPADVVHVVVSSEPVDRYAPVDPPMYPRLDPVEEVWRAVGLGLRDYVRKNGFRKVLLGVSGGIDSTVVATLAADVLGGENVVAISNPSKYSSEGSKDDAAELAKNLGLDYRVVPIQSMVGPPRVARADRDRGGEPAGARARRHLDGGGAAGPGELQQVGGVGRVLDDLRRQRGRVRPDQGRPEDPRVGAGPLAEPLRAVPPSTRRSPRRRSSSRRPPSSVRARPTRTHSRPTRSWTRSWPAT